MLASRKKELSQFGHYAVKFCDERPSRSAFILFHGFPANGFNGTPSEKNLDIAGAIFDRFAQDTYLMHYTGLGKSVGKFTFTQSVQESILFASQVFAEGNYSHLQLLGHSWGGLVSINVVAALGGKVKRVVLLSPLTSLPISRDVKVVLDNYVRPLWDIFPYKTDGEAIADLEKVERNFNPSTIAPSLLGSDTRIVLLQAKVDDEIPPATSMAFAQASGAQYREVDTDHSFRANRPERIADILAEF